MSRTSRKDTQRLSRRQFLGATAGTAIAAIATGAGPRAVVLSGQIPVVAGGGGAPELTLVNGRIHTMGARNTIGSS